MSKTPALRMTTILLTQLLLVVLTVQLSSSSWATEPTQNAWKPNILLIVVDDLGFADLGCLGSKDLKTPNLDRLFEQSLRLDRLYANCPVCSPTRASIITGCYPDRVGVPGVIRTHAENSWGKFSPIAKTLPQQLSETGYRTKAIGKWHLGLTPDDHPMSHGFDEFHGFLGDMMDDYYNHRRHGNNYMFKDRQEIDPNGHATDLFSDWATDWIGKQNKENSEQPWFLYLAYNAPHTPIQPPQEWLDKVQKRDPNIPETRAKLIALIEHMDAGIGDVLTAVSQNGTKRDTAIIFTSDNGGQLNVGANNGPLRDGKQSMYEGGLRIPGCIHFPSLTRPHTRTDTICSTADFYPTIREILGLKNELQLDGMSLLPLLKNPDHQWPEREIYFVRREGGSRYAGLSIEAVLRGNLKLVHNLPTNAFELFDLEKDPYELNDLAEKRPKDLQQLIRRLQFHLQRGGRTPWQ